MKNIRSVNIEQALERCRMEWGYYPEATFGWCVHHEELCEPLLYTAEKRIEVIMDSKPESEQLLRLDNFRPVTVEKDLPEAFRSVGDAYRLSFRIWSNLSPTEAVSNIQSVWDVYMAAQHAFFLLLRDQFRDRLQHLHRNDVPDNTWNGRSIFMP